MLLVLYLSSPKGGGGRGEVQAVCSHISLSVIAVTQAFLHVVLFLESLTGLKGLILRKINLATIPGLINFQFCFGDSKWGLSQHHGFGSPGAGSTACGFS